MPLLRLSAVGHRLAHLTLRLSAQNMNTMQIRFYCPIAGPGRCPGLSLVSLGKRDSDS